MEKKSPCKMAKKSPFLFGKLLGPHFKMNSGRLRHGGCTPMSLWKYRVDTDGMLRHQVNLSTIKFKNMFIR